MTKQAKITSLFIDREKKSSAFKPYIREQEKLINSAKLEKLSNKLAELDDSKNYLESINICKEYLSLASKSNFTDGVISVISTWSSAVHHWVDNKFQVIYSIETEKKQFEMLDECINLLLEFEQSILCFALSHTAIWFVFTMDNYHILSLLYFLKGDQNNCFERLKELYEMYTNIYNNQDANIQFIKVTKHIIYIFQEEVENLKEITEDRFNLKFLIAVDIVKGVYDVLNDVAFFKEMFIRFLKVLEIRSSYENSYYEVLKNLLDDYKNHCFYDELKKKWLLNEAYFYMLQGQQEEELKYEGKRKRDNGNGIDSLNKKILSHQELPEQKRTKQNYEQDNDQNSSLASSDLTSKLTFENN